MKLAEIFPGQSCPRGPELQGVPQLLPPCPASVPNAHVHSERLQECREAHKKNKMIDTLLVCSNCLQQFVVPFRLLHREDRCLACLRAKGGWSCP